MSGSMEFWATCVKPNKPVKVTVQDGMTLRLTQVAPHHLARGRASRRGSACAGRGSCSEYAGGEKCVRDTHYSIERGGGGGGGGGSPLGRAPARPAPNMLAVAAHAGGMAQ
jgi:hypothetical protein